MSIRNKKLLQQLFIAFVFAVIIVGSIYSLTELQESAHFNARTLYQWISYFGPFSALVYVIVMVFSVITPVPDSLVYIAGGYLFGAVLGTVLSLIGFIIGTSIDFWFARRLGRKYITRKFPNYSHLIDSYSKKIGWQSIVIMRIIPSLSFDFIAYLAGISSISFRTYLLANILGAFPLALFEVLLGKSLHTSSTIYKIVFIIFIIVIMVAVTSYKHLRKKTEHL
jgi:uncharacterized membrane protein YdjX (TVP38/TMEM64 family)